MLTFSLDVGLCILLSQHKNKAALPIRHLEVQTSVFGARMCLDGQGCGVHVLELLTSSEVSVRQFGSTQSCVDQTIITETAER